MPPSPRRLLRRMAGGVAGLLAALAPTLGHAAPATELLYERTLMLRADARCRLFTPDIAAALGAAALQASRAAIRAGVALQLVQGAEDRARAKADATPCGSRDLALAADRLRKAFQDYARLSTLTFPGVYADWRADRPHPSAKTPPKEPSWVLLQFSPAGVRPTLLGLSVGWAGSATPVLSAVNATPGATSAAGARLVMRDPSKAPAPYVDPRRRSLPAQLPPRALDQVFLAQTKAAAPRPLLPDGSRQGAVFQFPSTAADAIARLDPREALAVEFVYPATNGERVATAWIEVGDFAAARAFLAVARPPDAGGRAAR